MSQQAWLYPEAIVSAQWLAHNLSNPDLRIFECTMYLDYDPTGETPVTARSARSEYDGGHIPGAGYFDLQNDLSDLDSPFRFTMPDPELLTKTLGQHGIGEDHRIILYSRHSIQWSTRVWWMLHDIGLNNIAILDGGFNTWVAEGRAVTVDPAEYPPVILKPKKRRHVFVGKAEVLAAIEKNHICTINALTENIYCGEDLRYGRRGHIPGSVNVPAASLQDPRTLIIKPLTDVFKAFSDVGADPKNPVIVYCGGGVAATLNAFLLRQLGYKKVTVYDNSISEWASDPNMPMEVIVAENDVG